MKINALITYNGQYIEYIPVLECVIYSFDSSSRNKLWWIFECIMNKVVFVKEKKGTTKVTTMPEAKAVHLQEDCNADITEYSRA